MADRHIKVKLKDPEPNETSNFRQRIYYYDYWYPVTKAEYVEGLRNGSKWFDGTSITASTSPIPEGLDVNIGDYYLNSNTWNIWECVSLDDTETTDRWLLVGNIKGADGTGSGTVTSVRVQATSPLQSSQNTEQDERLDTTISLVHTDAHKILSGPSNGSSAAPNFRYLVASDLAEGASNGKYLKYNGTSLAWDTPGGGGGGGDTVEGKTVTLSTSAKAVITRNGSDSGAVKLDTNPPSSWLVNGNASKAATGNHAHGNINNSGLVTSTTNVASGDRILFSQISSSGDVYGGPQFGSSTTTFLRNDGTWATPSGGGGGGGDTTYKLTLNGTTAGDSTDGVDLGTLYAPTGAGTSGYILKSNGSGAPSWDTLVNIIGSKTEHYVLAGNSSGNVSWQQLNLDALSDTPTENKITLNGTDNAKFLRSNGTSGDLAFYAPTNGQPNSGGNSNQLLLSQGTNYAPIWSSFTFPSSGTKVLSYTNGSWSLADPSSGGTDTHRIVKIQKANASSSTTILEDTDSKAFDLIAGDNVDFDFGSATTSGYTGQVIIHGPDYQFSNYSGDSTYSYGCYGRIGYELTVGGNVGSPVIIPITMSARGGIPSGTSSNAITGTSDTSIDELSFIAGTNISFRKLTSAGYRSGLIIDANATISIATASNSPNGLVVSYDANFTNVSNYPAHYVGIPIYYDDTEKKHVVNLWDIIAALQVDNKENKDLLAALQSLLNT